MGKPPEDNSQLEQRVTQLEQHADETDDILMSHAQKIVDLDTRITALENAINVIPPEEIVDPPEEIIDPPEEIIDPPDEIIVPEPPQTGGLSATYVVPSGPNAGSYVYSEQGGNGQTVKVLDNYVDPDGDFQMTCIAVVRDDAPLQVIFRQVPGWSCVIFECCDILDDINQHMMPDTDDMNTVVISDGGIVIETIEMWGQWALGRWRWQSGSWPFPKDIAVLRQKKWLPLFDPTGLSDTPPAVPEDVEYAPMHLPKGYPLYVGGGGDPTLLSYVQGYWGANPNEESLANMLRQAEGLGAYPWFVRASDTWSPPNVWQGPHATKKTWMPNTAYSQFQVDVRGAPGVNFGTNTVTDESGKVWTFQWQGSCITDTTGYFKAGIQSDGYPGPAEPNGPFTINNTDITSITKIANTFMQGSGMSIDEPHSGSMWPFPWIATGDPYYLEALHAKYVMVWYLGDRPVPRAKLNYGQIRQTAWQLTSLIINTATTPEVTPSWLLPKSLWQTLWEDEKRLWDSELVHGTTTGSTVFHTVGATAGGAQSGLNLATWQEDMILQVTSWAAMLMPDCKWMAEWKVQDQVARNNGTSGWCEFYPEGYYIDIGTPDRSRFYDSWTEAWSENQKTGAVPTPNPTVLTSSEDYTGQCRGGLTFASQAGVTAADPVLQSLTDKMKSVGYTDGWNRLFAGKP